MPKLIDPELKARAVRLVLDHRGLSDERCNWRFHG